ncbi:fumarylacetoacetate hydrolase family protein [Alkaliphilus peptidifermentans]|uniref:2-keto-4-pentenoate hydratase/2-oxohepta-3-ene-1,7-dioic acid hydratase (Catechol pathway) n=1 Tax=Alkaliphilus peptidifermentans DSM 18978 TaxID=1120976 RepID=A0A1G5CL75_9FIRM|nr:fumarylacetoacetate hydrolase family protein [Alkaliphilus peptidifermentans]SCY03094.1 2-keto-4-pentenoate hydratase/2-oxohepta-3-ene-1,7-dioic acid hydratase (catechol pathway) [Alkaliphilus peptidifermentans DSM 18978]
MRFVTFIQNNKEKVGVHVDNDLILDLSLIDGIKSSANMLEFISGFNQEILEIINWFLEEENTSSYIKAEDIKVISPIPKPLRNIICLGLNYHDHVLESQQFKGNNFTIPDAPVYFSKMAAYSIGSGEEIISYKELTNQLDYEVELAVIIGKDGSNIPIERADEYIFGYSILNDVTARDLQKKHTQWLKGKSLDTFSVLGPCITHKSAIPFPLQLNLETTVNGELRQSSNTNKLIFDIPHIINDLSKGITLKAGDIIATGTPAGVGMGFQPPKFLKSGDIISCTIEKIGTLTNTVK